MRKNHGFTLIELMTVVLVAGIILGVAIPIATRLLAASFDEDTRNEMNTIREAMLLYLDRQGAFPPSLAILTQPVSGEVYQGVFLSTGIGTDQYGAPTDGWGSSYSLVNGATTTEKIIRSLGPNRVDDSGTGDDIDLTVDISTFCRDQTVAELAEIREALMVYNAHHGSNDPLPSDLTTIIDTLQAHKYLPSGSGYLTDCWGNAYIPGSAPVQTIDINDGTPPPGGSIDNSSVTLCHVPAGNPGAAHTMIVPQFAVSTHLAHGDTLGGCCYLLTFDTEDDFTSGLVNGQKISSCTGAFGALLTIDAIGGFGPAIFDSTIGGENDPGRDADLLVDLGNLVIIQENNSQSVPGIFNYPDDNGCGGILIVEFIAPVEIKSVTMVDIDCGNQGVVIGIADQNGWCRWYDIPGGFTRDVASQGPPGYRTLDLTTMNDQPGYSSTTTATEDSDYDGTAVVRMEFAFSSSAGIDNLEFCPN